MSIALLDPSICTTNSGDKIIVESVTRELKAAFPFDAITSVPTQEKPGPLGIITASRARARIAGGTNLLSSHMRHARPWKIGLSHTRKLNDVTLMGVGWYSYQGKPDLYTKMILKRVLSTTTLHSVRDEYTQAKLHSIGITNVVNTGCPTMWELTEDHCRKIPVKKADHALLTLSTFRQEPEHDKRWVEVIKAHYRDIFFWPQGAMDIHYLEKLGLKNIKIIPPTLQAFNHLLESDISLDYVGARLHGGIRSLQKARRSLILAVDNRATEIGKDTHLPVIERSAYDDIAHWISTPTETVIHLKHAEISAWRSQWKSAEDGAYYHAAGKALCR